MPRESKRKDDDHREVLSLKSRHTESIRRFQTAWKSQLDDYKQVYKDVRVQVTDDNVTIIGDKGSAIAISRDVEEFLKQHSMQEEFVDMALNMAKLILSNKRDEVDRLKEESTEDGGELDIIPTNRGIKIKGTEEICETVKVRLEEMKNEFLGANDLQSRANISADMRAQMINGLCDDNVKHTLKETRSDFEIVRDTEVPRAMGIYFSIFDPQEFQNMQADAISSGTTISESNELTTDRMASKMVSVYFSVNAEESPENFQGRFGSGFIDEMESKHRTVIEDRTKADSDIIPKGFLHDYMKMQVEDNDSDYVLYFCCRDLTTFPCDAVVNSSTVDLTFGGQLSGDIARKGGSEVTQECRKHIQDSGNLNTSDVFASCPGELDCKTIIHVASPQWQGGGAEKEQQLYRTVINILRTAEDMNLYSVALPAISAGGFGFPKEISIKNIFSAIKDYFDDRKRKGTFGLLKEVHFVDINQSVINLITKEMETCFGIQKVLTEHQRLQKDRNTMCYQLNGGNRSDVDKVLEKIKERCKGLEVHVTNLPASWSPMHQSEHYKLDDLTRRSIDFKELEQLLMARVDNIEVMQVQRGQNRRLYERMMKHKEMIKQEAGGRQDSYEMKLWHGTQKDASESIKKDGFSLAYVGKTHGSAMGRGLYFAKDAFTSHGYAHPDSNGHQYIFRCTVLVGKSSTNYTSRASSAPDGFHSVNNGNAYVVFRDTQCYPDYLLIYKNKPLC